MPLRCEVTGVSVLERRGAIKARAPALRAGSVVTAYPGRWSPPDGEPGAANYARPTTPQTQIRTPTSLAAQAGAGDRDGGQSPSQRKAHGYAREVGVSPALYALARALLVPWLRLWFRPRISRADRLPVKGAVIVAANHKSFLDAFFIALATRRPMRFMAKAEYFRGPLGWLFSRLGAFPVRRGEADAEAIETALHILAQGGLLVVFPEGVSVYDADSLGSPHSGAGRLAPESGAPIVPAAIAGTSHLWLGPIPRPRRVEVSFLEPISVTDLPAGREAASEVMDRRVWPEIRREYGRLLGKPGLVLVAMAALGIGGGLIARRRRRAAGKPWLLDKLEPRHARRRGARRRRRHRLRPLQWK